MAVLMEIRKPVQEKTMGVVDKKLYFLNHQLKLAKNLAANDENTRKRTLKNLKKWLEKRLEIAPFTEEDFQIIWKGLFYCMWMSDKPLIQEECADTIAKLIHLPTVDASLLFFKAGLMILSNEWFGIDQLRLDKFLMLVRRLLREMLVVLKNAKFRRTLVVQFSDVLSCTILSTTVKQPIGLFMHFIEIFLEELAKVSKGHIHNDRLIDILRPFIKNMTASNDGRSLGYLRKYIFTYLIRQSDLGIDYQTKYEAWKAQGFPGSIASMQKVALDDDERMSSDEDEEENNADNALDPRAGRVNVELSQIRFNPKSVVAALTESKFDKNSTTKSRKVIKVLIDQFYKLAAGQYPLGVQKIERNNMNQPDTNIRKAAKRLIKFEQKLLGKNRKRKLEKVNNDEIHGKKMKLDDQIINQMKKKEPKFDNSAKDIERKMGKKKSKKLSIKDDQIVKLSGENKKAKRFNIPADVECIFERNSGTWVVFEVAKQKNKSATIPSVNIPDKASQVAEVPSNSGYSKNSTFIPEVLNTPVKNGVPKNAASKKDSKDSSPQKSTKKKMKPFPKSSWEQPLQEGEYEIFIPAKKRVQKLNKTSSPIQTPLKSIKGKSRLSLHHGLVQNPFSKMSTPDGSGKKVKINVLLNKSQEVHEHVAQILSSPGIPYDASRKPSKPLLKARATPSPLNPFYKK